MAESSAPAPQMGQLTWMLISLMAIIGVMMFREQVGWALNFVFERLIGFGGNFVVPTLMLAGIIMIGSSTIIRTLMMDTMAQAKNSKVMSAFNAELRQARIENNLYKIKKLTEQQKVMMSKSMESSMKMMKTLPITMIIVIPIFAWVGFFLSGAPSMGIGPVASSTVIHVPWAWDVNIAESLWKFPMWIFIYTLITIPFGQLVSRLIRWYQYKKRLEKLDSVKEAEIV